MKKFVLVILWLIHVYSGDTGHLVFKSNEKPVIIDYKGRWISFIDTKGDEISLTGHIIVIRKTN